MDQAIRTVTILRELSQRVTTRQEQSREHQEAAIERAEVAVNEGQKAKELRIAERWRKEANANETVAVMLAAMIQNMYRA